LQTDNSKKRLAVPRRASRADNGDVTESPRVAPELPEGGPARRRDQILRTAADLFAADGYTSTSMREVAAAAGILKGSLYHHFESKEAIALELVAAYHEDLVRAARDFAAVEADAVTTLRLFTREVAEVSFRHRAALQITMYDMPATGGPALTTAARAGPASLERRWRTLISAASAQGALRPGVDPVLLRRVLHRASVQAGAAGWEWQEVGGTTGDVADCITTIIFDGLAGATDGGNAAGRPAALRVVDEARARWKAEAAGSGQERPARILAAARGQFALRGFEATTMRDIADAAGITAGNLYRYVASKDSLIAEVLGAFSDRLTDAYREVLSAGSTAAQALDAIVWLQYQAGRQFSAEVEILQGFGRMVALGVAGRYQEGARVRLELLAGLAAAGVADGELRDVGAPDLVATCLREIAWAPLRDLLQASPPRVRDFYRACVLHGATAR
jgi:AcrR family transcriptional regulator